MEISNWSCMFKIAEKYEKHIIFHPKPFGDKISGSGFHINVTTKSMRKENGCKNIITGIERLRNNVKKDTIIYDNDNKSQLKCKSHESLCKNFSYSIGGPDCYIRIGYNPDYKQCGYFEDRQLGAIIDTYIVTSYIAKIICNI